MGTVFVGKFMDEWTRTMWYVLCSIAILLDHVDTSYISSSAGYIYCYCVITGSYTPPKLRNQDNHS